jgi:hypothetical protein
MVNAEADNKNDMYPGCLKSGYLTVKQNITSFAEPCIEIHAAISAFYCYFRSYCFQHHCRQFPPWPLRVPVRRSLTS